VLPRWRRVQAHFSSVCVVLLEMAYALESFSIYIKCIIDVLYILCERDNMVGIMIS
jgi:hypothetical protein